MLKIQAKEDKCIDLGRRGEDSARVILFDITGWAELYGQGKAHVVAQRALDLKPYPVEVTQDNTTVSWVVTTVDNDRPGYGQCELVYVTDGSVVKSVLYQTHTDISLSDPISPPDSPDVYGKLHQEIGDLSQLQTENKSNIVDAVNEVLSNSGGDGGSAGVYVVKASGIISDDNADISINLINSDYSGVSHAVKNGLSVVCIVSFSNGYTTVYTLTEYDAENEIAIFGSIEKDFIVSVFQLYGDNVVEVQNTSDLRTLATKEYVDNGISGISGCTFYATVTLDGTVSRVIFSEDENGNPMSLDECWIITKYVGQTEYLATWVNGTTGQHRLGYRHSIKGTSTAPVYETQYFKRFGDSLYGLITVTTDNNISGMNTGVKACGVAKNILGGKKIEKIMTGSAFSILLAEGTTIEIFGR